jgi:hypothetical protein
VREVNTGPRSSAALIFRGSLEGLATTDAPSPGFARFLDERNRVFVVVVTGMTVTVNEQEAQWNT